MAKRRRQSRQAHEGRAAHAVRAGRAVADPAVVTIRAREAKAVFQAQVTRAADLVRLAEEWAYILRTRRRWTEHPDLCQSLGERALDDLRRAGVPRPFIRRLASVNHVEIELHAWDPADTAAARIHEAACDIPWEY